MFGPIRKTSEQPEVIQFIERVGELTGLSSPLPTSTQKSGINNVTSCYNVASSSVPYVRYLFASTEEYFYGEPMSQIAHEITLANRCDRNLHAPLKILFKAEVIIDTEKLSDEEAYRDCDVLVKVGQEDDEGDALTFDRPEDLGEFVTKISNLTLSHINTSLSYKLKR